ncbi:MAG TPA: ribonuclease P protein subunit [Thermoplasmatales archaeon]|nr:MAG: ribonuclease P protein subunit [Thermoplasmata archaeon]RLF32194.1 MAG: ribonuclease P protein subunit [Thermoplasmata archaeon]HDN50793.1 ribonuclease P protein subunit [Thermoplasmatales archaeon]
MTKNFLKQEFIGLPVRIINATDKSLERVQGEIIDETKHMLVIETEEGIKKVAKKIATFEIRGTMVEGKSIAYRPEDRIRKIK